ncbi:hypothetical protein B9Z55_012766 [Caenorhabditis nigoni]|uniref:F-box domain-containing protein n=1 Tax=Caenorhabditis nigoni TaxID=1611254 RepID=A0A2G5TYQ1_9PELO|nr:hypothetical protein B9Z55_012766 [Caenorhabditis nigoni]
MSSNIENFTEITEKSTAEPIYDTNWCHMPAEIKLKCIGKMEINERLSLRCTANAERSLVDSQKIEFYRGCFEGDDEEFRVFLNRNHRNYSKRSDDKNQFFEWINYIKKVGVFEKLVISFEDSLVDYEQFITNDGLFTAKNVKFSYCDFDNMIAVLRKLKDGVESIEINLTFTAFDELAEIYEIPQVSP